MPTIKWAKTILGDALALLVRSAEATSVREFHLGDLLAASVTSALKMKRAATTPTRLERSFIEVKVLVVICVIDVQRFLLYSLLMSHNSCGKRRENVT